MPFGWKKSNKLREPEFEKSKQIWGLQVRSHTGEWAWWTNNEYPTIEKATAALERLIKNHPKLVGISRVELFRDKMKKRWPHS